MNWQTIKTWLINAFKFTIGHVHFYDGVAAFLCWLFAVTSIGVGPFVVAIPPAYLFYRVVRLRIKWKRALGR